MSTNEKHEKTSSDSKPYDPTAEPAKGNFDDVDSHTQKGFLTVDPQNNEFRIKKGRALIISNNFYGCGDLERRGNIADRDAVCSLLEGLGCHVTVVEDEIHNVDETDETDNIQRRNQVIALTQSKIMTTIREISADKDKDLLNYDALIIFIMCHGTLDIRNEEYIETITGSVNVKWIYESFSNNKCKSLLGKPKLVFLQHCRGGMRDRGVRTKFVPSLISNSATSSDSFPRPESIAKMSEYFIANASFEGYEAYLTTEGSWFIQEIVKVFSRRIPQGMELHHMMLEVHRNISDKQEREKDLVNEEVHQIPDDNIVKAAPCMRSTMTKPVYFQMTSSQDGNQHKGNRSALYSAKHLDFFETTLGQCELNFFEV